jgi:uncharacterized protein DUF3301
MFETLLLTLILLLAWFWFDSVTKREIAITTGRELATRCHLQLLDETVACKKIGLKRDSYGRMQLTRLYEFEVSADGHSRLMCNLQLLGKQLQDWHIPPYLQPVH